MQWVKSDLKLERSFTQVKLITDNFPFVTK